MTHWSSQIGSGPYLSEVHDLKAPVASQVLVDRMLQALIVTLTTNVFQSHYGAVRIREQASLEDVLIAVRVEEQALPFGLANWTWTNSKHTLRCHCMVPQDLVVEHESREHNLLTELIQNFLIHVFRAQATKRFL